MHGSNTQNTSREQSCYDTVKLEENIFVEITGGVQEGHPFTHQIHTQHKPRVSPQPQPGLGGKESVKQDKAR